MTQTSAPCDEALPRVTAAAPQRPSRPLRILMVLQSAYPSPRGGAERQVRTLARSFKAQGHRVTVVTPMVGYGPQQAVGRLDGVPVARLRYPRIRVLGGLMLCLLHARFLLARRHRYDIWHVHIADQIGAVTALVGRLCSRPVMAKLAGPWDLERGAMAPTRSPQYWLTYPLLRLMHTWQATSQRIATALLSRGIDRERIVVIPNAVDTSRFRGIPPRENGPPRFIFVGRLMPQKALDVLLQAFARVLPQQPHATLTLVGDGPLAAELAQLANDLGVAGSVRFTGHRTDVETLLAQANIGVLCSHTEGLSNTLLESMASGLPMVASRVSGSEDFILDGENGWLCEAGDAEALARCMLAAAALPAAQRTALGESARTTVENLAGLDAVTRRLLDLYFDAVPAPAQCVQAGD
ncbi:MAG TPA: glycosyltransferase family 4 protein [Pseudoxanthomonas sp.]